MDLMVVSRRARGIDGRSALGWIFVTVCTRCKRVCAVLSDRDKPERPYLGRSCTDPCQFCGAYTSPDGTKEHKLFRHFELYVGRYNSPFRIWNPLTWFVAGWWDIQPIDSNASGEPNGQ